MICPSCKHQNADGLDNCDYCGTPLRTAPQPKRKTEAEMAPPAGGVKRVTEFDALAAPLGGPAPNDPFAPFPSHPSPEVRPAPPPSGTHKTTFDPGGGGAAQGHGRAPDPVDDRYAGRRIVGWLVTFDGNPDGTAHVLREGRNLLGRDPERCDIVVDDERVSRGHAVIVMRPSKRVIADDQSQSGTFLNEEDVLAPTDLKDGDVVRVGRTRFICRLLDLEKVAAIWKP